MGNITHVISIRNSGIRMTALTPTWVHLKKLSDNSAATQPAISEIGQGQYKFTYDAEAVGESAGQIDAGATVTASADRYIDVVLTIDSSRLAYSLPAAIPGALGGMATTDAANRVTANVTQIAGQAANAAAAVTFPASVGTSTFAGGAVASVTAGVSLATDAVNGASLAPDAVAEIVTGIFANAVETGETFLQTMRLVRAVLYGVSDATNSEAGSVVFKRKDGTTSALTGVYNAEGDRTSITTGTV